MAFSRILRSSALMGGAQVVSLAAGFVRAKLIAMIIGPAGVGLVGVLTAFNGNLASFAGWGLGTSGVRMISSATDEGKPARIAAVRQLGRRLSWLGLLAVVLLFWPVGQVTFAGSQYAAELFIAGLAVPCLIATSMWSVLLQAGGQIKALARVQMVSAFAGLALGTPLIYFLGTKGIAASLLLAAAVPALVTWNAARQFCPAAPGAEPVPADIRTLVKLGGALMVVALLAQLSAYVVRLLLIRSHGLEAAGYYQAAIAIAGSLPNFVFTAMGTDFFPRISAARSEAEAQELCEQQIQVGLLLALPLIAGLLTLGQICIHLLYARSFDAAIPLLSWMVWGVYLRLLAWPMGYWLLARGSARAVVIVESVASILGALLPLILVPAFGIVGAAMGFFLGYVAYSLAMLVVSRNRSGRWLSPATLGGFTAAALVLGLSQWVVSLLAGAYWGLIPTILIAALCFWIYFRTMRRELS